MNEGDILLAALPQTDGKIKDRPVLFLSRMPPFQDLLVCGISSQLQHAVANFDEIIRSTDAEFQSTGLKTSSVIRLGYLAVLPAHVFKGKIGSVAAVRLKSLLINLANHLRP